MFDYKVSVITAAYNVAPFLRETIDSLIQQDIGFENIQLILVNDGSVDETGAICDEYAKQYPNNITVIHKENEGVSCARNEGLKHVKGEYINFLDGDDIISPNTCSSVCRFFDEHKNEVDVVSFPIFFFDDMEGEHILNYKYSNGNRIIDLNLEYDSPQLSISSTFIKSEVMLQHKFDTRLAYAEDAQILIRILLQRYALGVVSEAKYMYRRRRIGEGSAMQTGVYRANRYLPYIQHFQDETIQYCVLKLGYVPYFVQYTLMYDLQWRITENDIPDGVLSEKSKRRYFNLIAKVLSYIDEKIIIEQRNLTDDKKFLALSLKYGKVPNPQHEESEVVFSFGGEKVFKVSQFPIYLEFLTVKENEIQIQGSLLGFSYPWKRLELICMLNESAYPVEFVSSAPHSTYFGNELQREYLFDISLPLNNQTSNQIRFVLDIDNTVVPMSTLLRKRFFPLTDIVPSAYVKLDNWVIQNMHNGICAKHIKHTNLRALEKQFCSDLSKLDDYPRQKAITVRKVAQALIKLKRKPLWLITDRIEKAGDNGEAFFRYMRKEHPEINSIFVISKDSPDFKALQKFGPVVSPNSFLYKILFLICDYVISSQAEEYFANPFTYENFTYRDIITSKKYVFLQHGIIKDDLSEWLNRRNKNLYGFITTTYPEYHSIFEYPYGYTEKEIWLTGLPRFDRLYHDEKKTITITPTWRRYLVGYMDPATGKNTPKNQFTQSDFYRFYNGLFTHPELLDVAQKHGYTIQVLLHPNLMVYRNYFESCSGVQILNENTEYRKIFAETNLLVTDYSSTAFDFAYLRKPVVYTHFDYETFFGGAHSYTKGYFDYEKDGMGEVEYDLESTAQRLIEYIKNDCKLKDKYRDRINRFFVFDDKNNCKRVYEKIMELEL